MPRVWNSTLNRNTPLQSTTGLSRSGGIRRVNPERKAKLFERNFGDYSDLIREMPCCVCGRSPVEAAHVHARGMGGCKGSKRDLVPMCNRCHTLHDKVMGPKSFQERFQIDLDAEASELWHLYGDEGTEG